MPSSLIFAALTTAWLLVLVPMIAKRRREVVRTGDSVLASRVLPRRRPTSSARAHSQEMSMMSERISERELAVEERRYRPGRGGYDPEAAELAARARYVFRQQVVLGLLAGVLVTLILAVVVSASFWWAQVAFDLGLAGYLGYLRQQVRIEEEIRQRRAARMAGTRGRAMPAPGVAHPTEGSPATEGRLAAEFADDPHQVARQPVHPPAEHHPVVRPTDPAEPVVRPAAPVAHPTAVALDLDDDDPVFDELDPAFEPPYRRAAGE